LKEKKRTIRIASFVDTWVWIEYWKYPVSDAKDRIESGDALFVSTLTITDVVQKYSGDGKKMVETRIDAQLKRCTLIPVDQKIATMAGMIRNREIHGGIAQTIILATA
jgi:predicted nucleic acid-binding protein